MTVQELIEMLEGFEPEAVVQLATQPNWPLAYHLAGVCDSDSLHRDCANCDQSGCDQCPGGPADPDGPGIVYLAEGSNIGYADKNVWENL